MRGVAVAVFAVLVSAWAVGLAGLGDTAASSENPTEPDLPNSVTEYDGWRSALHDQPEPRRSRKARPSPVALAETSPAAVDGPTDAPGTPDPSTTAPTTDPPGPSDPTTSPPPSSTPSHPPSSPPTTPGHECTDLPGVIDCALDPITGRP